MSDVEHPDQLPPAELTYHPKNIEAYGKPDPSERFIDDIGENGITQPIIVTDKSHFGEGILVISGHRRTQAAERTDQDVPIGEWKSYETPAEELDDVLRFNDYRDKTFRQKMGEGDLIKEIESSKAKNRMGAGGEGGLEGVQDFADLSAGRTRDIIADRINLGSGETYRKARKVWDSAQDADPVAVELVDRIDDETESIHGAYTSFGDAQDREFSAVTEKHLGQLLEDDQLTDEDILDLKIKNPVSVVRWLSMERGINPVADGTIPKFMTDNDVEKMVIESVELPIEYLNMDTGLLEVNSPRESEHYHDLMIIYENSSRDQNMPNIVDVAPDIDGSFHLLTKNLDVSICAAKDTGQETIEARVRNVDGSERESLVLNQGDFTHYSPPQQMDEGALTETLEELDEDQDVIDAHTNIARRRNKSAKRREEDRLAEQDE